MRSTTRYVYSAHDRCSRGYSILLVTLAKYIFSVVFLQLAFQFTFDEGNYFGNYLQYVNETIREGLKLLREVFDRSE